MYNLNTQHNYTLQTEIVTLEECMDEIDLTMEEVTQCYGEQTKCFVRAVLEDSAVGYYQRLFAGVYAHTFLAYAQATQQVTLELMEDYFTHCKKCKHK